MACVLLAQNRRNKQWGIFELGNLAVHTSHNGLYGRESRDTSLARSLRSSFWNKKCDASAAGCSTITLFKGDVVGTASAINGSTSAIGDSTSLSSHQIDLPLHAGFQDQAS